MEKKKIAFICPLSKPGTEIRNRTDSIHGDILKDIADDLNYELQRADLLSGTNLMKDIVRMLYNADIVIADLSDLNVNVFYELGLYHAIKGKFVTIMQEKDSDQIPFDVKYFRVHTYDYPFNLVKLRNFKANLRKSIVELENQNWSSCFAYKPEDIARLFNFTVVTKYIATKKGHYDIAKEMLKNKKCKNIFLMQRSSSLVLGHEEGWSEEEGFHKHLIKGINTCESFYHIISLEGIENHFKKKNSFFPFFKNFNEILIEKNGNVAIKNTRKDNKIFYLKGMPFEDDSNPFFKLDRQARVLTIEYEDGMVKTLIVQNLGDNMTSFLLEGYNMTGYLESCKQYYNDLEYVLWSEIKSLYEKYLEINKRRNE